MRFVVALIASVITASAWAQPITVRITDAEGRPLAGAAVALEQPGQARRARAGSEAEMAQRERQFQPRLLVIQTGTRVRFPNQDMVRHHVYSYSQPKTFELKLYLGEAAPPVLFDKPGVVLLGCNIHDQMSCHIVVVDTPEHGITDARGELKLERSGGGGQLLAWHPSLPRAELQTLPLPASPGAVLTWKLR